MFKLITFFVLVSTPYTLSHSWLACTDYTEKNGAYWDADKCRGFPRDAQLYSKKDSFGMDRGFDHKPGMNGKACKTDLTAGSYSSAYPKAVYYPGQQVILVHPMKNHGTGRCTNIHIPDNGNRIYHGMQGTDTNKPYSYYRPFLVADLGVSVFGNDNTEPDKYPKPGYQNAPAFCEDTDKAMGTYSFDVPNNFKPGEYTFVWRWSFNGKDDIYTTCFDVIITKSKRERDQILLNNGFNDLSVPCGGTLSNLQQGSTKGCGTNIVKTTAASTTTRPSVVTPTSKIPVGNNVELAFFQIAGEVDLGQPNKSNVKRMARVFFNCNVEARFWNARLVSKGVSGTMAANRFDLVQESVEQVKSGKIYFQATFLEPCDINRNPPVAIIV